MKGRGRSPSNLPKCGTSAGVRRWYSNCTARRRRAAKSGRPSGVSFTVACERGEAVLEGPAQIRWSVSGEEGKTESLTADRSEVEVMIDHFCRRLAGGLIPIADISDVCRCLRLVHAAKESHAKRSPVHLNGDVA